ncbi:ClC family H(+)/Cl(-) exchange transporter [Pseudoramibacter porci]|uniref:ClC family H(+)/Cl(-) exchange transporter n=1 Tax=Pseudoramibacter porci TaxID=2606631 RepID=A0A7X2T9M1_9FIRM|nr:ClC family H(+)/Cl(-) exchange transporter [Pseudoramibacter porci]MSS18953.1 ClC family H(+)/Cl(-) exchange transporter [Pseudoramibacter porci]
MPTRKRKPKLVATKGRYQRKLILKSTAGGLLVGLIAGGVSVVYRSASTLFQGSQAFMLAHATNIPLIVVYFFALLVLAFLVRKIITWEPFTAGSGISEVRGEVQGYFDMDWIKVLIGKFIGCLLTMAGGLSLGREGPSVQLGAMAGKGLSRVTHRGKKAEHYLITCGASAGLSAAFNCPLTGVMFALETFNAEYSVNLLFTALIASVTADFVSKVFFGMSPVFAVPLDLFLPLSTVGFVIALGVICGVTGQIFYRSIHIAKKFYDKLSLPENTEPVIPFLLAGVLGLTLPGVLGDGHLILEQLVQGEIAVRMIALLLAVKFAYSMLCFTSKSPGGSLAPMIVLGAFVGGLYGHLAVRVLGLDAMLINNFVILAMAGYFAAIVRTPLTAVALACELTGSFSHLIYFGIVVTVAEVVSSMMKTEPMYEAGMQNLLIQHHIISE